MGGMDPELGALTSALTRLDRDAARARLHLAAGGSEEGAAEIMRGAPEASQDRVPAPARGAGTPMVIAARSRVPAPRTPADAKR